MDSVGYPVYFLDPHNFTLIGGDCFLHNDNQMTVFSLFIFNTTSLICHSKHMEESKACLDNFIPPYVSIGTAAGVK